MADAVSCPNHEVNLQMCPCPNDACDNRGICCLCVQNHASKGQQSFCMRGTERPADTRGLRGQDGRCDTYEANTQSCACTCDACDNRGTCCDCVRNHWGNATYPTPACMS